MEQRIGNFLINTGLYGEGLCISKSDYEELKLFLEGEYKIDAYCPECDTERIFTTVGKTKRKSIIQPAKATVNLLNDSSNDDEEIMPDLDDYFAQAQQINYENLLRGVSDLHKVFTCAKEEKHTLIFCCKLTGERIIKYGQLPSLADLNNTKTKKYRKILGKKYVDFNRGIGLHSHGVGAGSLIYLRRIFEELIEDAHERAKLQVGWDEKDYPNRMDEKILKLKPFLPNYLVENRSIYGILSKGVHELSEDVCNKIFPVVRVGIELILDEKLEKEEQEKKKKETAILIQQLAIEVLK